MCVYTRQKATHERTENTRKQMVKKRRAKCRDGSEWHSVYLQTLQVRLRHGVLAASGFTVLLEIASRLAACDTLRDGPSAPPPADEKFPPSQMPDFWETWKNQRPRRVMRSIEYSLARRLQVRPVCGRARVRSMNRGELYPIGI